ncbi:MAG: hypothetical protein HQL52_13275 [Magnetococcales bacterium]|nr:hypothetical protein [Magnetococcales bacterium]
MNPLEIVTQGGEFSIVDQVERQTLVEGIRSIQQAWQMQARFASLREGFAKPPGLHRHVIRPHRPVVASA